MATAPPLFTGTTNGRCGILVRDSQHLIALHWVYFGYLCDRTACLGLGPVSSPLCWEC